MYLNYWGLRNSPFENVPTKNLFFRSSKHEEALIRLLYAVEQGKGAAMLTGEVGTGKTTVGKALINRLAKDRYDVKTIVNPVLDPVDLIRAILLKLGEKADDDSKIVLLNRLQKRLSRNAEQNLVTILIIDEAHLIKNRSSLEELRMLLNMQSESKFLITLILLGQPPLIKNIAVLKPLSERISIKYNLKPLDLQDTVRYILFRLKNSGTKRGIFTKESIFPLYEYSKGIPLKINNLCDRSLLIGLLKKAKVITTNIVNDAIEDLK